MIDICEVVLSEKVNSYEELLQESLAFIFGCDGYEPDKATIKVLQNLIDCQGLYQKGLQNKPNVNKKNKNKVAQKEESEVKEPIETATLIDEVKPTKESIFCNYFDLAKKHVPKTKQQNESDWIYDLISNNDTDECTIEYGSYATLLASAINRSLIVCKPRHLGDEILLNNSDIFAKAPQFVLNFDISKCTSANKEGQCFTGIAISRATFIKPKGVDLPAVNEVKGESNIIYNALSVMLCTDNIEMSPLNVILFPDSEMTVEDMLKEGLDLLEDEEQEQTDAQNQDSEVDPEYNQELYGLLSEAFKYVVYYLSHQNELQDENGNKVRLSNKNIRKVLDNKPFTYLGEPELKFTKYYI